MAIVLARSADTVDVVHLSDPDVDAPDGAEGWIPVSECVAVRPGATVLTLRPLDGWQYLRAVEAGRGNDLANYAASMLAAGLVAVDGSTATAAEWAARPPIGPYALDAYAAIELLTHGPFAGPSTSGGALAKTGKRPVRKKSAKR